MEEESLPGHREHPMVGCQCRACVDAFFKSKSDPDRIKPNRREIGPRVMDAIRNGKCIGGPHDGLEVASVCDKVTIPVNPHPPSEEYRRQYETEGWSDPCPSLVFDQVEYRWANGAWHYAVH
jgi:hypothetical protein